MAQLVEAVNRVNCIVNALQRCSLLVESRADLSPNRKFRRAEPANRGI